MLRNSNTSFLFLFLLCFSTLSISAADPNNHAGNRIRLHVGPAIGFYKINTNHATDPNQRISALIGFNKEFRLSRDYKSFFLVGADYFFHGLNFKSYYFSPDSIKIYDKNFSYTYTLYINELNMAYEGFFSKPLDHTPVLIIDSNNLNIIQNPEHLKLIEDRIRQSLSLPPFQQSLPLPE